MLKLRGIDSISEAEAIVGWELSILESDLPAPEPGSFYTFQLKGCRVIASGEDLGEVRDVLGIVDGGGTPILKVDGGQGEILIPFASSYLRTVDLEHRRIEVDLPDGLRDLNK